MTDKPNILALDQGTTSTRAVAYGPDGSVLASHQVPLKQHFPDDGWVEHDAEEIFAAACEVCRVVLDKVGPETVAAMGITNQRETTVVWDRATGTPIMHAIVWQDRRTVARCNAVREAGQAQMIRDKTGLEVDAYFSATKIEWMLDHVDGARVKAEAGDLCAGTIDSWLIWKLTNGAVHATDATNASRTMFFNIHSQSWDGDLLSLFNVPSSVLPDVRDTAGDFGTAAAAHLGAALPILSAVGDQQSALVGQACVVPGLVKSTYGTGCFLMANTGAEAVPSLNRLLTTVAYRLGGDTTYALEGSIFNAGTVVQWLRDEAGLLSDAAESGTLAEQGRDAGVYMVPAFTGLGAPHWDGDARGGILGLKRDTSRADLVRAALDSVCFQTADLLNAMVQDGMAAPDGVRVDGGMTVNNWLLQRMADLMGLPVERPVDVETTVRGAGVLASLALGRVGSLVELMEAWPLDRRFAPQMHEIQRTSLMSGWQTAVNRLKTAV